MPTITDHLQAAREHAQIADDQPASRYPHAIGHLILAIDQMTEAVDKLLARLNQLERDYDNSRNESRA